MRSHHHHHHLQNIYIFLFCFLERASDIFCNEKSYIFKLFAKKFHISLHSHNTPSTSMSHSTAEFRSSTPPQPFVHPSTSSCDEIAIFSALRILNSEKYFAKTKKKSEKMKLFKITLMICITHLQFPSHFYCHFLFPLCQSAKCL